MSIYFLFPPFSIPPFSPYAGNKNFFLCQVSKLVKFDNKAIYALHRNKSERVNDSTLGLYSFFWGIIRLSFSLGKMRKCLLPWKSNIRERRLAYTSHLFLPCFWSYTIEKHLSSDRSQFNSVSNEVSVIAWEKNCKTISKKKDPWPRICDHLQSAIIFQMLRNSSLQLQSLFTINFYNGFYEIPFSSHFLQTLYAITFSNYYHFFKLQSLFPTAFAIVFS